MRGSIAALLARTSRAAAPLLVLSALVVALVCVLSVVVPGVQRDAADASVRAAAADPDAVVTATVPLTGDDAVPKPFLDSTDDTVEYVTGKVAAALPPAYEVPIATLVSRPLAAGWIDDRAAELRLAHLAGEGVPAVTWTEGREPGAAVERGAISGPPAPPPPVEVGLTRATAELLGVGVGDAIAVEASDGTPIGVPITLVVAGVFEPVDFGDWAWGLVPSALEPLVVGGGDPRIAAVALLSGESVPFARFALPPGSLEARYVARPDPSRLTADAARELARDVRALTAAPDAIDVPGVTTSVTTRADAVIQRSLDLAAGAGARATVVLLGLVASAASLLALAASVLAGRRRAALVLARARGASLVALAGVTAVESLVVAVVGGAVAAGVAVGGGAVPLLALAPMVAAVLLPTVAVLATVAGAESPRSGAPRAQRLRQAARAAVEVVVVSLAVVATVTLRTRGDGAAAGTVGADLVVLGAAPLIAGACAVVALRVAPWLRRAAIAVARRDVGAVGLLASVRAGLGSVATVTIVVSVAMTVLVAASGPVSAGGDGARDPVEVPFVEASDVTRALGAWALAGIAVVAVVLIGVADRSRRDRDGARARALGLPAAPAAPGAGGAAPLPGGGAAAAGVAAGMLTVALVVPGADVAVLAPWWAAVPALAALAGLVARGNPSRQSLASRLRAG